MFRYFEHLVDPFPDDDRTPPDTSIPRFVAFYARSVWKLLLLTALLTAAASIMLPELFSNSILTSPERVFLCRGTFL